MLKKKNKSSKIRKKDPGTISLGVGTYKTKPALLSASKGKIVLATSVDGSEFSPASKKSAVRGLPAAEKIRDLRISESKQGYILTHTARLREKNVCSIYSSKNFLAWKKIASVKNIQGAATLVPHYLHNKNHTLYVGGKKISVAYSKD